MFDLSYINCSKHDMDILIKHLLSEGGGGWVSYIEGLDCSSYLLGIKKKDLVYVKVCSPQQELLRYL